MPRSYRPSKKRIAAETAKFRATWDETEFRHRATSLTSEAVSESRQWTPPLIRLQDIHPSGRAIAEGLDE